MAKAVIFGVNGQDGALLTEFLIAKGFEVFGVSRSLHGSGMGDVCDRSFVSNFLKIHKPEFIFHFAANSSTHHDILFENHDTISGGTLNILESARINCPQSKIFISGSAMQFRNIGAPINELTPFEGSSPYAVARIQSVYAARYFRSAFGMKVYVGYLFNHDSHLRSGRHINQKIVNAVKSIESGGKCRLEIGNVEARKEFNYAGDIIQAIWILLNQNNIYEAVLGSGEAYSIRQWLEYCFGLINKNWHDFVDPNPNFRSEYEILVSDPSVIRALGWSPRVGIYELADIMMAD